MERKTMRFYSFYLLMFLIEFLLPLLIRDTGSGMFVLLVLVPVSVLVISGLFAMMYGFQWIFPLFTAALWIPVVFLYMNESAMIYLWIYGGITLLGQGVGHHMRRCDKELLKKE